MRSLLGLILGESAEVATTAARERLHGGGQVDVDVPVSRSPHSTTCSMALALLVLCGHTLPTDPSVVNLRGLHSQRTLC